MCKAVRSVCWAESNRPLMCLLSPKQSESDWSRFHNSYHALSQEHKKQACKWTGAINPHINTHELETCLLILKTECSEAYKCCLMQPFLSRWRTCERGQRTHNGSIKESIGWPFIWFPLRLACWLASVAGCSVNTSGWVVCTHVYVLNVCVCVCVGLTLHTYGALIVEV